MNILEINTTEKAKIKIKRIAKNNNLSYDFVYNLASFVWNFNEDYHDKYYSKWVENLTVDNEYIKRKEIILNELYLQENILNKNNIIKKLYNGLLEKYIEIMKNNFLYGSLNGNNGFISEYATYYYLTNATKERLETLYWGSEVAYNEESIMKSVFMKIYNGGMGARNGLEYCYTDLIIKLPYETKKVTVTDWTANFIKEIENNKLTLTDLIKILRHYCKGDKYFLQIILEALSYSGILKVKNHDIKKIFLPDFRDTKSKHYYSNEWTYPLRFWNE
jgi:hypothetical protein